MKQALRADPLRLALAVALVMTVAAAIAVSIASVVVPGSRLQWALDVAVYVGIAASAMTAIAGKLARRPFLARVEASFSAQAIEGTRAALSVMGLFVVVSVFWALWDQHSSSWILQARSLDRRFGALVLEPDQIPAINPILVMGLIPLLSGLVYPALGRAGYAMTPLRRMYWGMFVSASSFFAVTLIQLALDRGAAIHVGYQLVAYVLLTSGEVLVSITGLEFAYTQAPPSMKSTLMSFWMLTTFLGNVLTAYVERFTAIAQAYKFGFFGLLMLAVAVLFRYIAHRYTVREYIRDEDYSING